MSDLARVLARIAVDAAYRGWLRREPRAALRGYELNDAERDALVGWRPGAHAELLGRAAREMGIGEDVWAPSGVPESTGPAPRRPPSALDGLPAVSVQLRLGPGRAPDGRTVWSISLVPPGQNLPPRVPGEARPWLRVAVAEGQIAAWIAPEAPLQGGAVDVDGPRWSHRVGARERRLAARVREVGQDDRLGAIEALIRGVVQDGEIPVEAPEEFVEDAISEEQTASGTSRGGRAPDIVVVGLGLSVEHLTREAEDALRTARQVLSIDTSPAVRALLAARCPRVRPLFEAGYRQGSGRLPTYLHLAARVLHAALDDGPVVLAVQGHPTLFSYIPVLLRDVAPLLDLTVRIQPGISSRAGLLAHLALDPADHGIRSVEATDLLLRRRPLSPDTLTLVWQAGNLETRLHSGRPSRPERLHGLTSWLQTFYPDDHPVTGVVLSTAPGLPTEHWTVPLAELPSMASAIHASTTLILPPVGRRPLADAWLASVVDDPAHLLAITRPLDPGAR